MRIGFSLKRPVKELQFLEFAAWYWHIKQPVFMQTQEFEQLDMWTPDWFTIHVNSQRRL